MNYNPDSYVSDLTSEYRIKPSKKCMHPESKNVCKLCLYNWHTEICVFCIHHCKDNLETKERKSL
jgi:hypothetical protein